jgi:Pentapeptide repeats (8 copies)
VHEWIVAATLVATSFAAVAALFFTRQSIQETNSQLRINEQGQITDRYNAAITNLGSGSIDIRLGGIYALQRLMQAPPPRDQPTIIAVLCAFVRDRSTSTRKPHEPLTFPSPTDIQAAVAVVADRNRANDGRALVVDLANGQLAGGQFVDYNLTGANLTGATLTGANLTGANLTGATLDGANLTRATLDDVNLSGLNLARANLASASLTNAISPTQTSTVPTSMARASFRRPSPTRPSPTPTSAERT